MYEGIQSDILSTTKFVENSDLSTTYLGTVDITRASTIKPERKIPNIRTRVYSRKAIGQHRMSDTIGIQELANHLYLNHIICIENHLIHCQNSHPKHREYR